jgi:copper(I)-binding protein
MRIVLMAACILLAACGAPQPPLVASEVEITRPMPGRNMSAGFMVLTNNTDREIRITSATSPQYETVEIHETTIDDGIARMRPLDALLVPARGSVTLRRGGKHLMLMHGSETGDSVAVQFFTDGVPVLSIDYTYPESVER